MSRNDRRSTCTAVAVQSSELQNARIRTSVLLVVSGAIVYKLGLVLLGLL